MKTYSVTLLPQKVTVSATQGQNLLALLQKEGFAIDAPCGGNGNCGKCRVRIDGKEVLACRTEILRDMTVMLPQKGQETVLTRGNLAGHYHCGGIFAGRKKWQHFGKDRRTKSSAQLWCRCHKPYSPCDPCEGQYLTYHYKRYLGGHGCDPDGKSRNSP